MATQLGCAFEPREILQVLKCAVEKGIITDQLLKRIWWDRVSQPSLRIPQRHVGSDDAIIHQKG
eukprot:12896576-Prorocentrum_lima.AAC.1